MKEQEFDIYVRNLLAGASEPVPESVWEGVQAGLKKPAKAPVVVLPFWRRMAIGVAAAAAVIVGVVLLRPVYSSQSGVPAMASARALPMKEPVLVTVLPKTQIPRPAPRTMLAQAASFEEVPVQQPQQPQQQQAPQETPQEASLPQTRPSEVPSNAGIEDWQALEQLAQEAPAKKKERGLGFSVSGDVQMLQRGAVNMGTGPVRTIGAPPVQTGPGIYNATAETYFAVPVSAGVGVYYNFNSRWALGAGVRYSYLGRSFVGDYLGEGFAVVGTAIDNHQSWLGVPVNVYFNIFSQGRWQVHAMAGGAAEFLLDNHYLIHNTPKDIHFSEKSSAPQWSADLGVGVLFRITPFLSIYLDPQLRYYFNAQNQPRSLRTIQPLRFDVEAGLRFDLGRQK